MRNYAVIRSPDYIEHGLLDKLKKVGKTLTSKKLSSSSKKEKSKSGNNKTDNKVRESGVKGDKSKYKGGFVTKGDRLNNSQEYNHDYYIQNQWRWSREYRDGVNYLKDCKNGTELTFSDGMTWTKVDDNRWAVAYDDGNMFRYETTSSSSLYREYDKEIDNKLRKNSSNKPQKSNPLADVLKKAGSELAKSVSDFVPDSVKRKVNSLLEKVGLKDGPVSTLSNSVSAKVNKIKDNAAKDELRRANPGIPVKKKDYSVEEDMAAVNPHYRDSYRNGDIDYLANCALCTTTYDLRRRGYDVTANDANSLAVVPSTLSTLYKNKDGSAVEPNMFRLSDNLNNYTTKTATNELFNSLNAEGDGARGMIVVYWWETGGGHAMAWENVDGKTYVLDTQANKKYDAKTFASELASHMVWDENARFSDGTSAGIRTIRTDDKDISDVVRDTYMVRNSKDYVNENVRYRK